MSVIRLDSIPETHRWVREEQCAGRAVGLVPTMGALHEGHLSLVRAAADQCDVVIASVFVNPTQFGPGEDYERYPRDLESDAGLLEQAGADALFAPSVETMYPDGEATTVDVGEIGTILEGAVRPSHFRGVATVVAKLLNIAPADRAYLGQKDYQQTVVIRQMVRDLDWPTAVVVCPTVRESDGLAMSSRNAYLSPDQRRDAIALHESLRLAEELVEQGEQDVERLRSAVRRSFAKYPAVELEYADFLAHGTLTAVESVETTSVLVVAARLGPTRLIDNTVLRRPTAS